MVAALLSACGASAPAPAAQLTPTAAPTGTTATVTATGAASSPSAAVAQPGSQTHALQWSVDGVERLALDRPAAGSGQEWLLVRTTATNPGAKAITVKEQQVALTVDGQGVAPDKDAIDAAERKDKGKGFGGTLGVTIGPGKSDARISVFRVPLGAREFALTLKDERAGPDLAAPLTLTALVGQAPALPTPTVAPTAMPKPPTPTAAPQPPTPTAAPIAPTATATEKPVVPTVVPQPPTAPPATGTVSIISVTGGSLNSMAGVTAQTIPGTRCSITYTVPSGAVSEAGGLEPMTADDNGHVSWSWKIAPSTRPGEGRITVSCGGARASTTITVR